jgi:hypothetical protein
MYVVLTLIMMNGKMHWEGSQGLKAAHSKKFEVRIWKGQEKSMNRSDNIEAESGLHQ